MSINFLQHCEADDASGAEPRWFTLRHTMSDHLASMCMCVSLHISALCCVITALYCCLLYYTVTFLTAPCRGGFCRFSSSRYTLDKANLKNLYMHLTNVAIQKKNEKYDENTGMKWPISKLKQYLLSKYGLAATSKLFGDIQVPFVCKVLSYAVVGASLSIAFKLAKALLQCC